ncbi:MAG TPA: universal stress protein [Oscillatoriaceae cyanobacterium]
MKVLITTDGAPCSEEALESTLDLMALKQAEILVLAVAQLPLPSPYEYVDAQVIQQLSDSSEALAKEALDKARKMLEARGLKASYRHESGVATDEILRVAQEFMPDLLVLGSHGRGMIGRFFLGSVSEAVLHRWRGPVLLVQQKKGLVPQESASATATKR